MTQNDLKAFHFWWKEATNYATTRAVARAMPEETREIFAYFGLEADYDRLLVILEEGPKRRMPHKLERLFDHLVKDCCDRLNKALDSFVEDINHLAIN